MSEWNSAELMAKAQKGAMALKPQRPDADPDAQEQLYKGLRHVFVSENIRPAEGIQANALDAALNEVYSAIPKVLPDAKNLPPKPTLYIFDSDEIKIQTVELGKRANAIVISSQALEEFSPREIKAALAVELSHQLLHRNPDLIWQHSVPNLDAVSADLRQQNISPNANADRYSKYMESMASDNIMVHLTGDPDALISILDKARANRKKLTDQELQQAVDWAKFEAEANHRTFTPQDEERAKSDWAKDYEMRVKLGEKLSNPHGSDAVRAEAAQMVMHQIEEQERGGSATDRTPLATPAVKHAAPAKGR